MRLPKDIIINGVTLEEILRLHGLWLNDDVSGVHADLSGADLTNAYLTSANLAGADLTNAYLTSANLTNANLRNVKLTNANLKYANLTNADLDFSSMPLWCGDLKANYDDRQIIQQLFHVMSHIKNSNNASEEIKELLTDVNLKWANKFHRVDKCGIIEI